MTRNKRMSNIELERFARRLRTYVSSEGEDWTQETVGTLEMVAGAIEQFVKERKRYVMKRKRAT